MRISALVGRRMGGTRGSLQLFCEALERRTLVPALCSPAG
jgi:hypothetical protein